MKAKIGNCEMRVHLSESIDFIYNRQFHTISLVRGEEILKTASVPADYKASQFMDDVHHYRTVFSVN